MDEIRCTEFVARSTDLLEGVVPEPELTALLAHTDACGDCAEYLRQLRATVTLLGTIAREAP